MPQINYLTPRTSTTNQTFRLNSDLFSFNRYSRAKKSSVSTSVSKRIWRGSHRASAEGAPIPAPRQPTRTSSQTTLPIGIPLQTTQEQRTTTKLLFPFNVKKLSHRSSLTTVPSNSRNPIGHARIAAASIERLSLVSLFLEKEDEQRDYPKKMQVKKKIENQKREQINQLKAAFNLTILFRFILCLWGTVIRSYIRGRRRIVNRSRGTKNERFISLNSTKF